MIRLQKSALRDAQSLSNEIRSQIEKGKLAPGTKLPNTTEWAHEMNSDPRLFQAAMRHLAFEGFLERKRRIGTFVKSLPQKPCVLVLILYPVLASPSFHSILLSQIQKQVANRNFRIEIFPNGLELLSNDQETRQTGIRRLQDTLDRLSPVGYIQVGFYLNRIPQLYQKYKRPTVTLSSSNAKFDVAFDPQCFYRDGTAYLASKGKRNILLLRHDRRINPGVDLDAFWDATRKNHFLHADVREVFDSDDDGTDYEHFLESQGYHLMKNIIQEWKTLRKNYIPDCILVSDDVLMKGAALALVEERHFLSADILLVVLTIAEIKRHFTLPIVQYILSIEDLARTIIESLDAKIEGRQISQKLLGGRIVDAP